MSSPLSLTSLGLELDSVRRSRAAAAAAAGPDAESSVFSSSPSNTSASGSSAPASPETQLRGLPAQRALPAPAPGPATATAAVKSPQEKAAYDTPLPLCLLCFTRPPSAVLLPCCHLNLCYLCAPLLIHRGSDGSRPTGTPIVGAPAGAAAQVQQQQQLLDQLQQDQQAQTNSDPLPVPARRLSGPSAGDGRSAEMEIPRATGLDAPQAASEWAPPRAAGVSPSTSPRAGFGAALSRAVAGNAKARRLSMGGYVAPKLGVVGGELRGRDVLPVGDGGVSESGAGLKRRREEGGKVVLEGGEGGARCLVCRAGVAGWLRVYTG